MLHCAQQDISRLAALFSLQLSRNVITLRALGGYHEASSRQDTTKAWLRDRAHGPVGGESFDHDQHVVQFGRFAQEPLRLEFPS